MLCLLLILLTFWPSLPAAASPWNFQAPKCQLQLSPSKTPWNQQFDFKEMEERLRVGTVTEIGPIHQLLTHLKKKRDYSSDVFFVRLDDGTIAIWRPMNEYEPGKFAHWRAELDINAYRLSQNLDIPFVPPIVRRKIGNQPGTLQLYVTSLAKSLDYVDPQVVNQISPLNLSRSDIFLLVAGNWDRGEGNLGFDSTYTPIIWDVEIFASWTRFRLGEMEYMMRGKVSKSVRENGLNWSTPFAFDSPQYFEGDFQSYLETLGPYLRRDPNHPEKLDLRLAQSRHRRVSDYPEERLPYVIWNEMLWVQLNPLHKRTLTPTQFPDRTMEVLGEYTLSRLRTLYPSLSRAKLELMAERIRRIQKASRN